MTDTTSLLKPKCLCTIFNARIILKIPGVPYQIELDKEQAADVLNKLYDAKFELEKLDLN